MCEPKRHQDCGLYAVSHISQSITPMLVQANCKGTVEFYAVFAGMESCNGVVQRALALMKA